MRFPSQWRFALYPLLSAKFTLSPGLKVVNARAALLSNYEVLTLLRELESDHLARTKAAIRIKKEEEAAQIQSSTQIIPGNNPQLEVSENLRTMEVEASWVAFNLLSYCNEVLQAIQYLSADYLPAKSQTDEGITQLLKDLAPYDLTKAEKLQIVNLAPTMPVELYVVCRLIHGIFLN